MTPEQRASLDLFGVDINRTPRHDGPYCLRGGETILYSELVKRYRDAGKRLYLAAPFSDRAKMEDMANRLKTEGFTITARWVYGGEDGLTRQEIALLDLADVDAADTVVSFTFPRGTLTSGGGRHVEFGYALARGKRCVVIGERENVFHHFPGVEVYPSVGAWLAGVTPVAACAETV